MLKELKVIESLNKRPVKEEETPAKVCVNCGKEVPADIKEGDVCPSCGKAWNVKDESGKKENVEAPKEDVKPVEPVAPKEEPKKEEVSNEPAATSGEPAAPVVPEQPNVAPEGQPAIYVCVNCGAEYSTALEAGAICEVCGLPWDVVVDFPDEEEIADIPAQSNEEPVTTPENKEASKEVKIKEMAVNPDEAEMIKNPPKWVSPEFESVWVMSIKKLSSQKGLATKEGKANYGAAVAIYKSYLKRQMLVADSKLSKKAPVIADNKK